MSEKVAGECLREMWAKLSASLSANPATTKALAEGLFQRKIIPNATRQEIAHSILGGGHMASTLMSSVDAALRTSSDGGRRVITALIEEIREQGLDDLSKELSKKYKKAVADSPDCKHRAGSKRKQTAQETKGDAESNKQKDKKTRLEILEDSSTDTSSLRTRSPSLMSSSSSMSSPDHEVPVIKVARKKKKTKTTRREKLEDCSTDASSLPAKSSSSGSSPEDTVPAIELGIDDLFTLLTQLKDVVCHWEIIGLALHLSQPTLDVVKANNLGRGQDHHLRAMLQKWLNWSYDNEKFGNPSWKFLVEALEVVEECKPTAKQIKKRKPWKK